jgi:hypothetical protein
MRIRNDLVVPEMSCEGRWDPNAPAGRTSVWSFSCHDILPGAHLNTDELHKPNGLLFRRKIKGKIIKF